MYAVICCSGLYDVWLPWSQTSWYCCVQDWLNSVSSKQAAYHAVAQYYQSMVSKESKEFGQEIARLKVDHI